MLKRSVIRYVFAVIVLIAAMVAMFRFIAHQVDIDRCFDRGGVYDYANQKCITE